ncbi:hypothetical protein V6N12_060288 [Hibiscus sabdariffa]|uniref:Uncharacterized protein n=1 Tax=Hibiscus sabdariffa TaxID=183260 RepID=A0ABR2D4U3_9ROSI
MTLPIVLRLVEELTEASTLRLHVEVGGGCHAINDVCDPCGAIGSRAKLELPKEGGEEDIPRDKMSLNKFATSEVGEDPRCGACGKEGWDQLEGGTNGLQISAVALQSRKMWVTDSLTR